MRVTIQGLRRWIVIAAGLLLAVVAGFLIYGRNRFRHIEKDLPGRLGINIQQTASGFSYTQTSQGHALFTLKASKELQMKSGHVLLHEVDVTLYGPPGSGRTDRIYGSDFDYDQTHGIITSQGDVNIDLQGAGRPAPASGASPSEAGSNTIRVRTRGLTFLEKTGEASTAQQVEFQLPRGAGTAVGADYNSKTGVIVLQSQVHITTSSNGKAAVVDAAHATLLRASDQALLVGASMNYETEEGSSDQALVYFRKDGTTEKIDAAGHVHMKSDNGATVDAVTAHILFDARSEPTRADLGGGVRFASSRANETLRGSAAGGTLLFTTLSTAEGSRTALRHGEFRQDVNFEEDLAALPRDPHGRAEKTMRAETLNVEFAPAAPGKPIEARTAVAEGNPVVTSVQTPSKGPQQTTRIGADRLVATLGENNVLRQLDGSGHTEILQSTSDGSHNTTRGDQLHATFVQEPAPHPASSAPKAAKGSEAPRMQTTLDVATQDGNVVLSETPAKKPGSSTAPATLTGWAGHAEYHASDQLLHLTGKPHITDGASMQVAADRIDYHRDTENAAASGNVKATYTEQAKPGAPVQAAPTMGGSGPVHVIADRALLDHASSRNLFYGTPQSPARMWQDADSLLAPLIEIDRARNLLKASGENTGTAPVVNANFTSAAGSDRAQSVVQVHSQTLVYSDKTRQGDFRGSVTAEQGNEVVHADQALLFLRPAPSGTASASSPASPGQSGATSAPPSGASGRNSQLDHLLATGHVVFTQPGRRGDGERLLYTAADGRYVLTGSEAVPPRMWDSVHGTTTGAALIFNSQNDSVEVSGGKSSTVTETRARK